MVHTQLCTPFQACFGGEGVNSFGRLSGIIPKKFEKFPKKTFPRNCTSLKKTTQSWSIRAKLKKSNTTFIIQICVSNNQTYMYFSNGCIGHFFTPQKYQILESVNFCLSNSPQRDDPPPPTSHPNPPPLLSGF